MPHNVRLRVDGRSEEEPSTRSVR